MQILMTKNNSLYTASIPVLVCKSLTVQRVYFLIVTYISTNCDVFFIIQFLLALVFRKCALIFILKKNFAGVKLMDRRLSTINDSQNSTLSFT